MYYNETYSNFMPLAESLRKQKGLDLNTLILKYQKDKSPQIFAYTYIKFYSEIISITNQYFNLTEADKTSFALEELHKCLMDFNPKKAKFQTMLKTYLKRRLYAETSMLNHQKRSANTQTDNFDDLSNTTMCSEEIQEVDFDLTVKQLDLTDNEYKYCKIIMSEPEGVTNTEIAQNLNVSNMAVTYLKRRLQSKLIPLIA